MSEEVRPPRSPGSPRSRYFWAYMQRRQVYVWLAVGLLAIVVILLVVSASLQDWGKNLALNLSADLIGTIIVLFAVSPFLARAESQGDHVRGNFDRAGFIRQAADARRQIQILELWTDMLQEPYRQRFLSALLSALKQQVTIRMLLLSPDGRAAEQRADDLRQKTDVAADILENLRIMYDFVHRDIPEVFRRNVDVRVYSALPPVQMYQVDRHVTVSFYPVSVTSWNATQYVTSPDSQLGTFVGEKFDELWKARSTRSLDQFWETTVIVGSDVSRLDSDPGDGEEDGRSYSVRFVTLHESIYVSGQRIVADHAEKGIAGLTAYSVDDNVTGTSDQSGPFSLLRVDSASETYQGVRQLFRHKYGREPNVLLELAELAPEPTRAAESLS